MRMVHIFLAAFLCAAAIDAGAQEKVVHVSEFGAKSDDGKDDLRAILKAISKARRIGAAKIVFDRGVYDVFCGDVTVDHTILVENFNGLHICGAVDEKGNPATKILRHYEMAQNLAAKNLLRFSECKGICLSNLVFDCYPRYMTSGKVTFNDGNTVAIQIFDGCTYEDNTVLYCCNLWNLETGNLKHTGSVTFGGPVSKAIPAHTVHTGGPVSNRMCFINNPEIAKKCEVGDGISWHFGWNGVQVQFVRCDDVMMENVWSHSAIGFHFSADLCRNVSGHKVRVCREGADLCAGSRDAWKMWLCSGKSVMDDIYIDGVRWDGQNVHGKFIFPISAPGSNTMTFTCNGLPHDRIEPGDKIGFWKDRQTEMLLTVKSFSHLEGNSQYRRRMNIEFEEAVPEWVDGNTIVNVYSHCVDYTLRNSNFSNIAGAASVIRNDNSLIENCTFRHMMYPAVTIGAELFNESVTTKNVTVRGCIFEDCSWQRRYSASAAIAVESQPCKGKIVPYLYNITITGNQFLDCDTGVAAKGVDGLILSDNEFVGVKNKFDIADCKNIVE